MFANLSLEQVTNLLRLCKRRGIDAGRTYSALCAKYCDLAGVE